MEDPGSQGAAEGSKALATQRSNLYIPYKEETAATAAATVSSLQGMYRGRLEVLAVSSLKGMYRLERGKNKPGGRRKRRFEISIFSRMSPEIFFFRSVRPENLHVDSPGVVLQGRLA